jgi:hypothetical protein
MVFAEKTSLKSKKTQSSLSLSPPMSTRPAMLLSDSKAGTTPLASKPAMNATIDLRKGLRWRLIYRWNSLAWITDGRDAADVLLK